MRTLRISHILRQFCAIATHKLILGPFSGETSSFSWMGEQFGIQVENNICHAEPPRKLGCPLKFKNFQTAFPDLGVDSACLQDPCLVLAYVSYPTVVQHGNRGSNHTQEWEDKSCTFMLNCCLGVTLTWNVSIINDQTSMTSSHKSGLSAQTVTVIVTLCGQEFGQV